MKYIDADKLRAEIERLKKYAEESKKDWINEGYNQNAFAEDCRITSFNKLLSFLDTIEEPVSEDLKEEIKRMMVKLPFFIRGKDQIAFARHFAKWGAEHTPLPEDTVIFQKGVEEGKRLMMEEWLKDRDGCFWDGVNEGKKAMEEQMMKEAVEGIVEYNFDKKSKGYYSIRPTYVEGCVGTR